MSPPAPSSMRMRRLQSDYESVQRLAHLHPRIRVEGTRGNPPDRYVLLLKVRSLREQNDRLAIAEEHRLEITLPKAYPRDAPVCRMLTPVFHPNIAPHAVCIGDHWTAAESLDLMIQRVGEMLAFQSYNVRSPLNGRAAQWVEQNLERLPIDRDEFFVDLGSAAAPADAAVACANCGTRLGETAPARVCDQGHRLCADCGLECERCGGMLCLCCGVSACPRCQPTCANCGTTVANAVRCAAGHALCGDCVQTCATCAHVVCLSCGESTCSACAPKTPANSEGPAP